VRLIAFDLETTGLEGDKARIIEFCFVELDESLADIARWTEMVDPQVPIPPETSAIHGITDAMVKGKTPFSAHASRIQALVQDAVLVAHNHQFDLEILSRELVRAGMAGLAPNHPCIDTQQIERFVNGHGLGACYQRYVGAPLDGAHRSEADTMACVAVLRGQRERHAGVLPADLESLLVPHVQRHFRPEQTGKRWLDHGHKFYADKGGNVLFGFGKHRDRPAKEHVDYLLWMRDKGEFPADVKAIVAELLGQAGIPLPGMRAVR
jgi:DNA polymerase-3 subunit epsilon